MYGIEKFSTLLNTLLFKHINTISTFLFSAVILITSFIESHIYSSPEAFYFLILLYLLDFATGVFAAIKLKKFNSRNFPRVCLNIAGMIVILGITFTACKHSPLIPDFLPTLIFSVFVMQNIISIVENLHKLGAISAEIVGIITTKLTLKNITELIGKIKK